MNTKILEHCGWKVFDLPDGTWQCVRIRPGSSFRTNVKDIERLKKILERRNEKLFMQLLSQDMDTVN